MADINVTINPAPSVSAQVSAAPEVDVTIGDGIPKHAVTHAPGGSDSLEAYYATTGSLAYVSGLTTGIGNTGYLTGYVSKSETGNFYPTSNPSGFITGVDLSSYATQSYVTGVSGYLQNQVTNLANSTGSYVTGSVVRPSETGNFITSSQTGQFVSTDSTGVFVTGSVVRPSQTGAFLTTGAADARYALSSATGNFITTSQTGVFASQTYVNNVSGHLQTQVTAINNQTGNFALKSQTGSFITTSQTGQFVGTGQTGYYTGIFYPYNSNPLGYVQGAVVRPSQTGAFLTTGAGDNRYALQSNTGIFVTTGQTGNFVTGSVVRPSETGNFITTAQTGQFVGDSETGAFLTTGAADARYALQSNTGNFITQSQTGQFYAASNPSGFITGVDLSSYATTSYVTGVSGDLQNKINIASGYAVTGYNDSITGIEVTGNLTKTINLFQRDGGVLSASFSDVSGSGGALIENAVYTTGNQNISGEKRFYNEAFFESGVHLSGKLTFNTGFLPEVLDGEVSWNNEYGTVQIGMNNGDVVNPVGFKNFYRVKANASIAKGKVVMAVGTVGNSEFILAQEAANIGSSGELIIGVSAEAITAGNFGDVVSFGAVKGINTSSFNSGAILYFDPTSTGGFTQIPPSAPNAKVITAINLNPSNNGTVFVRVSAGSVLGGTDSNVKFSTLQDNDFIAYNLASGLWYNKTLTTGDVSGINNYVLKSETGSFITTSQTGQFVGDSETGAFLTTGAADGRYALQSATGNFITTSQTGAFAAAANTGAFLTTGAADNRYALQSATGNFINTSQTGAFAAAANTGAFLTTGAADGRYYGLANGQSISGYAITGYNDAITGMSVTGDSTKTITLFQRDGTNVSANFTDNGGSVSNVVFTTGDQTISGIKTFTGTILAVSGIIGSTNTVSGANDSSIIAGTGNRIRNSNSSIILAGQSNIVSGISAATNIRSAILGGRQNAISGSSDSVILGGTLNSISSGGGVILGGFGNRINSSTECVIAGSSNNISGASNSFSAGTSNTIRNGSTSSLAFGSNNIIDSNNFSSAIGYLNIVSGAGISYAFGYGTKADRYGIKTFGSDFFSAQGDAQNFERTLYANSQNGEVKTLSSDAETVSATYFNLFHNQSNKIMLATIKVLGVDEDANVSQYMRKAVISVGSTGLQQIKHIESIGTDTEDAGKIFFSTNDANLNTGDFASTFCIFGSGLAGNQTRWMAHVNAIELNLPPSYP
jgi:hypothetical protein